MCLITQQTKPSIATKDIEVHKYLLPTFNKEEFTSILFKNYVYKLGVLNKTNIEENSEYLFADSYAQKVVRKIHPYFSGTTCNVYDFFSYGQGFHSFIKNRKGEINRNNPEAVLVECVIPKGSKYYLDLSKTLLISNQIIIKKQINQ